MTGSQFLLSWEPEQFEISGTQEGSTRRTFRPSYECSRFLETSKLERGNIINVAWRLLERVCWAWRARSRRKTAQVPFSEGPAISEIHKEDVFANHSYTSCSCVIRWDTIRKKGCTLNLIPIFVRWPAQIEMKIFTFIKRRSRGCIKQ